MNWITDNSYTCPLLMFFQSLVKPKQFWRYGSDGWVLMALDNVRASCIFPRWLIGLEVALWNSKIGIKLRSRWQQQREFRLRLNQVADKYIERSIQGEKRDILNSEFVC